MRTKPPDNHVPVRLLFTRKQAAELLGGINHSTLRRLESAGLLKPVRLNPGPGAMVFYRADNVRAVAMEGIGTSSSK